MSVNFLTQLAIYAVISIAAYLIAPKPKGPKPPAVKDFEAPTAEGGIPIAVPFGDITIEQINVLWYGQTRTNTYMVDV